MNVTKEIKKDYEKKDTWSSGKNEPKTNPIKANSNPIKANFKRKKQPGCSSIASTIRRYHSALCLHRNRLSRIIEIAANLEEKMQVPGMGKTEKMFEKGPTLQYITQYQPDYKRKYNVDKIAYRRDNDFFYFFVNRIFNVFRGSHIWYKGSKVGPRVSERTTIMKRYLIISAWLAIFAAAFVLACRREPPAEPDARQPEPNVPAQIDKKAVEPKQVTKAAADTPAVVVNGAAITEKELEAEIKQMAARMPPAYVEKNRERIRQQTLDRMITMRLLDAKVKAANIVVTEQEVSDQIKEIADQQGMSLDDFKAMLKTRGMNFEQWKQQMQFERRIQFEKLLDAEFAGKLQVTIEDANKYYSQNRKRFETPEQVRASHILLKPDPNADPNEAKAKALAKAQDLHKQVKDGADFAELARNNSDCPSKSKGGDLGFFSKGRMVPPFEKAAFTLKINEISDVVETRFGYHIIKVTERKEASTKTFEQARDEIIKMQRQKKQGDLARKYIDSLRNQANIVYPPGKEPKPTPPPMPTRMPPRTPTRTPPR